jgi:NADH-ubiquinone oxidoreductase chain 6
MIKSILLNILALFAILSSVLVITAKNPVISVLYLISLFINTAGYLIVLGIGFVGIAYILVYIGAITVLFLFVIMMINIKLVDILEVGKEYTKNLPLALSISFIFLYMIFAISNSTNNNIYPVIANIFSYPLDIINSINKLLLSSPATLCLSEEAAGTGVIGVSEGISDNSNFISVIHSLLSPINLDTNFIQLLQIEMLGQGLYTYGAY